MNTAVWDVKSHFSDYAGDTTFDCMIAEFLLSCGRGVGDQEVVLKAYNVDSLAELAKKQQEKLRELPKLQSLLFDIELPLIPVLHHMEATGIAFDSTRLVEVGREIDEAIVVCESTLYKEFGKETNLNSSVQVGNYLAEKLGVPLSKTKTGRFATNEAELQKFASSFSIIKELLQYRELTKLRSTYVESLRSKVDEKGRIHTTYNQAAASTGRLSSVNPNLQNIPVMSHFGQKIKSCFVASKGHVLLSFDYSQQELRILAHLSQEDKLMQAFATNQDIHTATAHQIFGVQYSDVTKEQRMIAKTINFGIIYGMGSFGLSSSLAIPVDQAQAFIHSFYETYPKIKTYYDEYLRQAKINGYVETLLGRRRYVFEYPQQKFIDNAMKRVLMNFPIQGTAADCMKKAMVQIDKDVLAKEPKVKLLLQIHDDVVFEVPHDQHYIMEVSKKIADIMCHVYPLTVPVEVGVKTGENWGDMKPFAIE